MSLTLGKTMYTLCATAVCLLWGPDPAGGEQPVLDHVGAVTGEFERLQAALRSNSAATLEAMLADTPERTSNRKIASLYVTWLERSGDLSEERRNPALFLRDGVLLWVKKHTGRLSPWLDEGACTVWLRSRDGTRRGFTGFVRQDGVWKWYAMYDPSHLPSYDYDLATPTNAFLTLGRAMRPGSSAVRDIRGIYDALADEVRSLMGWEEYAALLEERASGPGEKLPGFYTDPTRIEEEAVAPAGGRPARQVWRLSAQKERESYELFVKEGEQWKWLPGESSMWHPSPSGGTP